MKRARWWNRSIETGSATVDLALAVPRVFAGIVLASEFGWSKFPVPAWFVEDVGKLGFPIPVVFAWVAVLTEIVGGALLAAGLFTRIAAFLIVCTMAVATLLQKAGDPLWERLPGLFFLVVAWVSLWMGSGRFGLDGLLARRR